MPREYNRVAFEQRPKQFYTKQQLVEYVNNEVSFSEDEFPIIPFWAFDKESTSGKKLFWLSSFDNMYQLIQQSTEKCYYEMITSSTYCKLYIDIDAEGESCVEVLNIKVELLLKMITTQLNNMGFDIVEYLILSAHGRNKKSFHIIVTNVLFTDNMILKQFLLTFNFKISHLIDFSVYSKVRAFRMMGNSKRGQSRPLIIHSTNLHHEEIQLWYHSLVTCHQASGSDYSNVPKFDYDKVIKNKVDQPLNVNHEQSEYATRSAFGNYSGIEEVCNSLILDRQKFTKFVEAVEKYVIKQYKPDSHYCRWVKIKPNHFQFNIQLVGGRGRCVIAQKRHKNNCLKWVMELTPNFKHYHMINCHTICMDEMCEVKFRNRYRKIQQSKRKLQKKLVDVYFK